MREGLLPAHYRTRLCAKYLSGSICPYACCQHAHSLEELRVEAAIQVGAGASRRFEARQGPAGGSHLLAGMAAKPGGRNSRLCLHARHSEHLAWPARLLCVSTAGRQPAPQLQDHRLCRRHLQWWASTCLPAGAAWRACQQRTAVCLPLLRAAQPVPLLRHSAHAARPPALPLPLAAGFCAYGPACLSAHSSHELRWGTGDSCTPASLALTRAVHASS